MKPASHALDCAAVRALSHDAFMIHPKGESLCSVWEYSEMKLQPFLQPPCAYPIIPSKWSSTSRLAGVLIRFAGFTEVMNAGGERLGRSTNNYTVISRSEAVMYRLESSKIHLRSVVVNTTSRALLKIRMQIPARCISHEISQSNHDPMLPESKNERDIKPSIGREIMGPIRKYHDRSLTGHIRKTNEKIPKMSEWLCENNMFLTRRSPALLRISPSSLGTFFIVVDRPENAHKYPARSCHMRKKRKPSWRCGVVVSVKYDSSPQLNQNSLR